MARPLLYNPVAGALAVVWLIGACAIVFGILLVAFGIKLRGLERSLPTRYPLRLTPMDVESQSLMHDGDHCR